MSRFLQSTTYNLQPSMFDKITTFFKEARVELKKVVWPTRKEVGKGTLIVIFVSIATAIFLGVLDLMFGGIIKTIIS